MHKVSGSMPQLCIVILPTKAKEIVFDGIGLSTRPVSVCLSVSLSLAIVNNCSLNSSREISELQQHMHKASVFVFLASVFVFLAESPTMHLDLVT